MYERIDMKQNPEEMRRLLKKIFETYELPEFEAEIEFFIKE